MPPGAKTKLEATEVQASYPDRLEEETGTQLLSEPQGQDAREPTRARGSHLRRGSRSAPGGPVRARDLHSVLLPPRGRMWGSREHPELP